MRVFDFPVSLQRVYTKEGKEVPRVRSVVRDDTGMPISCVSDKYTLVHHKEVVDRAEEFFHKLGTPDIQYTLGENGRTLLANVTFKDRTFEVAKNDIVGLRVFVQNSYDASSAVKVRIGALRLACLNGMVVANNAYSYSHKHKGVIDIELPSVDSVLNGLEERTDFWRKLVGLEIQDQDNDRIRNIFIEKKLVPQSVEIDTATTAWDLYNNYTYHITHDSKRLSPLGTIHRLSSVDKIFNEQFAS